MPSVKIYPWDYLTPWGWKKIEEIRLDKAVQLFVATIKPHIGDGAVLLGQELILLERCEKVDSLTQVWLGVTVERRKNWKVEITFNKGRSQFVAGDSFYYHLEHEIIVVCFTTDGKLQFVKSGCKHSRPDDFSGNWKQEFLASPVLAKDLTKQTRLILEVVNLLSFVDSDQSLRWIFRG